MKKVSIVSLVTIMMIVISSCGSSNNVVSDHGITKRKYNKGYFFQRNSNIKTASTKVEDSKFIEGTAIAKTEKTEAVATKVSQDNVSSNAQKGKKNDAKNEVRSEFNAPSETHEVRIVSQNEKESTTCGDTRRDNFGDGFSHTVAENQPSSAGESMKQMPSEKAVKTSKKSSGRAASGSVGVVLLVILAILIPPLAVFLYEGVTQRFWIDLVLAILGYGIGFGVLGLGWGLLGLIAVIYALLIVLEVI